MKKIICIVCPNSCEITISDNQEVIGNKCPRGKAFALQEVTNPLRALSTTMKTNFASIPVVPVKVSVDIPKKDIPEVMKVINNTIINERLGMNEVVIKNVCNTGADVILISDILKEDM